MTPGPDSTPDARHGDGAPAGASPDSALAESTLAGVALRLFDAGEFGLIRLDAAMRIVERHGRLVEGITPQPAADGLPFLIGYEDVLAAVGAGDRPSYTLPTIALGGDDGGAGRVHSVKLFPGPRPGEVVLLLHDVTERAALEQRVMQARNELALAQRALLAAKRQAEAATAAKSQFLRLISHDLRTPLGVVIGNAEILRDEAEIGGQLADLVPFIDDIRDSGRYLLDMINDLLEIARGEAGALTLDIEAISPLDPVTEAVRIVRALPGAEALAITLEGAAELPAIAGDRRRLQRVFVNLLDNAVKFTPAGGRVAVNVAAAADGGAIVTIADTGIGIAAADREHVLEPFVRGPARDECTGDGRTGVGLGLAITRLLTERHGGRLILDSTPGAGTTVTVTLPPADRAAAP